MYAECELCDPIPVFMQVKFMRPCPQSTISTDTVLLSDVGVVKSHMNVTCFFSNSPSVYMLTILRTPFSIRQPAVADFSADHCMFPRNIDTTQ